MPKAKKLPSGSWRVQVYAGKDLSGKRKYESFTEATKKEAEYQAVQWQLRRSARPEDMTVYEAVNAYIESRSSILSPTTIQKYRSMARTYYEPLRSTSLRRITSAQVQSYINSLAKDKSPKTISCVYGLLTAVLAQYAPDLALHVHLPRRLPHEIEIPTPEDVAALIAAANDTFRPVLVIASSMGLRRAEISALTWSDVRDGSLTITKAYVKTDDKIWVLHAPKSNAGIRTLEIPPAARPYLTPPPGADPSDRIVPLTPDAITRRFEKLTASLGMTYRFHSLRHYYDRVLLSLGVPDKYIMARMGHATPTMTKQVYQHVMQSKDDQVTAAINQFFA